MPHKSTGSGIYCIKNNINNKVYIGQALHLERRLYEHKYYLEKGKDKCVALQRAINKYGMDCFDFSIIEYCLVDDLNTREIFYIQKYNSNNKKYGYNIASGGNSGLIGYKWPAWFGEKISKAKKGWVMGEKQKEFLSNLHKGKVVSEETKKKMSLSHQGQNHNMYGKKHKEESKKKMSDSHKGDKAYQYGKKMPNSASPYFGVYPLKSKGHLYWTAQIKQGKEHVYIGSSKDETEAAKMYDAFVKENNLPNPLNFPE